MEATCSFSLRADFKHVLCGPGGIASCSGWHSPQHLRLNAFLRDETLPRTTRVARQALSTSAFSMRQEGSGPKSRILYSIREGVLRNFTKDGKYSKNSSAVKIMATSNNGQGEENTWRQANLNDLEREVLGFDSGVAKKQKAVPPRRTEKPRRGADGGEWTVLDELAERGFMMPSKETEEAEWYQFLVRIGKRLASYTEKEESSEDTNVVGPGTIFLACLFPVWGFLVLVAAGTITLPPQLLALQSLLRSE